LIWNAISGLLSTQFASKLKRSYSVRHQISFMGKTIDLLNSSKFESPVPATNGVVLLSLKRISNDEYSVTPLS
jgi:hypothetical protein